jgi:glycosyltransferase involved in cell wall biosynthesis
MRPCLKILFVSHSSVLKYHQQKLEILAAKHGHEIILCTPPYWHEGGIKTPAFTGGPIRYEIGNVFMFKRRMLQIYLNAENIVKKANPDIVHVEEEPFTFAGWQFIRAAKRSGKKSVFFTWENINRPYNPLYTYFNNYCIKNSDAMIAGNEEAKDIFRAGGFAGYMEVIPQYGLNMDDFIIRKGRKDKNSFTLGYIGRITPEKGIETLVDSLKGLDDVKLILAGTGSMEYTAKIEKKSATAGEGKVQFAGFLGRDKIAEFLSSIDALVLPSLTTPQWKEQFGRVIIEAFASKTAVIGSSSGEIPNVIGDAGLIFREGDAEELKRCVQSLASDQVLYKEIVEKGFERVKNNYTNEIIAAKIDGLYKKLQI